MSKANPLDEYLMEKKAGHQGVLPGFKSFMGGMRANTLKNFRTGAEEAIGSGAVGLAATGLGMAALKIYRAVRKREDFRQMMAHNPELKEFHEQDPVKFNQHYNSLRSLVPAYAEDPIIAGSYMRQMSLSPESAGAALREAMESRAKTGPTFGMESGPMKYQTKF